MSPESRAYMESAVLEACDALNDTIGIFTQMAKRGRYPQELQGKGWEYLIHARDSLKEEARRCGILESMEEDEGITL